MQRRKRERVHSAAALQSGRDLDSSSLCNAAHPDSGCDSIRVQSDCTGFTLEVELSFMLFAVSIRTSFNVRNIIDSNSLIGIMLSHYAFQ